MCLGSVPGAVATGTFFVYYFSTTMTKKSLDKFFTSLANSHTEEDVKYAYAKYFDIDYDTAHGHDLYTKTSHPVRRMQI